MIVPHVVLVLMNVPLRQLQKVQFTKLILMFAQTAVLVLMFARLNQFTLNNQKVVYHKKPPMKTSGVFLCSGI
jgi:hypothetical protein